MTTRITLWTRNSSNGADNHSFFTQFLVLESDGCYCYQLRTHTKSRRGLVGSVLAY